MPFVESHLGLQDSVVRMADRFCEDEICCLWHRIKISVLCLLYNIYHRAEYPFSEYLHHFAPVRSTGASAALGGLALLIPHGKTDQLSQSFLPADVRLWKLLPSCVSTSGILSSFKSFINLYLQRA